MYGRFTFAVLIFPLSFSLISCSTTEEQAEPTEPKTSEIKKERPPEPQTPEEFLDRASETMREAEGWLFAVRGKEALILQGQGGTASYTATVQRTQNPEALHSQGTITSKGKNKPEEIFVIDDTAYIKEGNEAWKQVPVADPETENKVEDPMMAVEAFRQYLKESADDVTLVKRDGQVRLQVRVASQKFSEVQERAFAKKAVRELDPTLAQLQEAGVPVSETQLTLSRLEETLILDATTHRIKSHQLQFRFLIPYGNQNITYEQDVREETEGIFDGTIQLPM
jgi:hypothetical protein